MINVLNESVQFVKGIGPKKAEKIGRLGIKTIKDALFYFPRQFEDRSVEKKIIQLEDGDKATVRVSIRNIIYKKVKSLHITQFDVYDDTGSARAVFFNKPYLRNTFRVGDVVRIYGSMKITNTGSLEINNCEIEYERDSRNTGIIMPVYKLTYGISNKDITNMMRCIFESEDVHIREYLPQWMIKKYNLCDINFAIKNMHFPDKKDDVKIAMYRLIFEEFLFMQLGLFCIKGGIKVAKGINFSIDPRVEELENNLKFRLTHAQKRTYNEILQDMNSDRVMNRLVQGDVGSGKTVIAQLALANCVYNGKQGAYMAPTEILAKQHYDSFMGFFEGTGIRVELLTGSTTKSNRDRILEELKNGEIGILIGTHALIEDRVEFCDLGLVITDEQHRFGVRQRAKLNSKASSPDILVMSATPIPRTLALILYGELDISVIDQLPPGRQLIDTVAIEKSRRRVYYDTMVRSQIQMGRQVYVVCPLVEESEVMDISSATEVYEELSNEIFTDLRVGLLHGKMKNKEKDEIMNLFKNHDLDILVSTTVIEVGVNVPNATIMIIENSERFGLSQLHQLRGRVGRGSHKSYCALIYDSKSKVCRERMKIMEESNDGFKISEKDLEIRGPGDFFGTRQHGLPELRVANLFKHMRILRVVQKEARNIYSLDPSLSLVENRGIRNKVEELFNEIGENISL